jgi:hypothetical protein
MKKKTSLPIIAREVYGKEIKNYFKVNVAEPIS